MRYLYTRSPQVILLFSFLDLQENLILFYFFFNSFFPDNLIKRFIETQKDIPKELESFGEVNLQIDLRQVNQQKTLSVTVVSAQNLKWKAAFK